MLLASPVLTYTLSLALYTKKKEERDNKRKKTKRRNHNKVNKQDKRGTEKRERERERGTYRAWHQKTSTHCQYSRIKCSVQWIDGICIV
jgi:hypothetical protein